jgi:ferrochelatase
VSSTKAALILVNLGTPEAPTPSAVRDFLKQFLSDRRVVSLPRVFWWPLLHGLILPFRSSRVARLYRKIWWPEGSPLKVITQRQVKKLAQRLPEIRVSHAMVYGAPSLAQQVERAQADGIEQIVVLPLYPQYCSATTGSVCDQLEIIKRRWQEMIQWRLIESYHDHAGYIDALATSVYDFWQSEGRGQQLLFSFHGIPQKLADSGDPYYRQCHETAALVANALQLADDEWQVCFQSRFGKAEWVKPYTDVVLGTLPTQGIERVDVITPAFASDCLETLEEIAVQNAELFQQHGGKHLRLIPCLNDCDAHIDMMCSLFAS